MAMLAIVRSSFRGPLAGVAAAAAVAMGIGGCAEEGAYGRVEGAPPPGSYQPPPPPPAAQPSYGYEQAPQGGYYGENQPSPPPQGYGPGTPGPYQPPPPQSYGPGAYGAYPPPPPQPQYQYGYGGSAGPVSPGPVVVQGPYIEPGTRLLLQLDQPIGTQTSSQGQRFTAHVVSPVVDAQGREIVPRGAQVVGTVAQLQPGQGDRPAIVVLTVDAIQVNGFEQPLDARIIGTDVQASRRGIRPLPIVAGAVGGAVLGAIVGHATGALVGGALGAAAGTVVSLGTAETQASLPAGTALAIELQRPVSVAAIEGRRRF